MEPALRTHRSHWNPRGLVRGHTTRCPRLDTHSFPMVSDETASGGQRGVAPLHPPPGASPWTPVGQRHRGNTCWPSGRPTPNRAIRIDLEDLFLAGIRMSFWSGVQQLGACMAIMLTLASTAPALAQSTSLDLQEEAAFKQAATLAEPSIVQIQTVGGLDVVDQILVASGPTTGVIVSDDGYVITSSFNFLNKPSSVIVLTADGEVPPPRSSPRTKAAN